MMVDFHVCREGVLAPEMAARSRQHRNAILGDLEDPNISPEIFPPNGSRVFGSIESGYPNDFDATGVSAGDRRRDAAREYKPEVAKTVPEPSVTVLPNRLARVLAKRSGS